MQSSQHSNIELFANIIESPHTAEERRRGPGDKPVWGRSGASDLQLSNGGSEKYHFSKIVQNVTANELYAQAGLKTMVGRAITGVNVSLISVGMPQTFTNCEQVEREEKAQFLTLAQEILKTIVNAPERRERYCAAAVVQIDPAGKIHPFDDSLRGSTGDASGYKERVKMPFGLWHGDHGIVLPPEIFQEMCCQQDIDHFFTIYRVSVPTQGPKSGVELVSMDNIRRGMDESSYAETSQRSTHPHANDVVPPEAALMFVAEIFQSVSKGHDMRSTVVLLYVPQRAERSITKHLWTSFDSLLQHGKLTHAEVSSSGLLELHPISNICQHILYGGGVCATIFNIPREERNLSHTLSILRHTKLLRAAKLLMPVNYYHMPACASTAITQFHQFQKGIKRDLSSAFAAGMYDGWKVGLKSAIKVVEDRITQMRLLARFYLEKTRDSVLLRYEMIGQSLRSEYQKRKEAKIEQSIAQEESERILECKSRKQAQIDSIVSERSAQKEESINLTDRIEEKRLEIEETKERRRECFAKFQDDFAELIRKFDQVNSETEFIVSQIQASQKGDEQATKEHKIIFQLDYLEQVEVKRQEKDALLEKLRHLTSMPANDTVDSSENPDPVMREIKEISSVATKKEQELAVIEAQIAVLEKSFAQRWSQVKNNEQNAPETPGELSRFLSPGKSGVLPEENEQSDCVALKNISLLIEQSPFDPRRLKKRDLQNITEHTASPQTPAKKVGKVVPAVSRQVSRGAAPIPSFSRAGTKTSAPPQKKSHKTVEDTVKVSPVPISSRLRSSTNVTTLSHAKTKSEQNVQRNRVPRCASISAKKDTIRKIPNEPSKVRKSIKKNLSRNTSKEVKKSEKVTTPKAVEKNEKSRTALRSGRDAREHSAEHKHTLVKKNKEPQKSHLPTETKSQNDKTNLAKLPGKGQKGGSAQLSKTQRVTTPTKQAVLTKSLVYQKLSRIAKNGSRKRDIENNDPTERSAENPEKILKSSGSRDSNGVVVLRKSATPRNSAATSPMHDRTIAKDASTGRRLVPVERDDSPGKLPSVGAMIRNFISNGTNAIQRTVQPRVLDFADNANELFSFLHSDNSTSPGEEARRSRPSKKNNNPTKKRYSQKR